MEKGDSNEGGAKQNELDWKRQILLFLHLRETAFWQYPAARLQADLDKITGSGQRQNRGSGKPYPERHTI
jgi:hypothetical protein